MKTWVLVIGSLAFASAIAAQPTATADELANETDRTATSNTDTTTIPEKTRKTVRDTASTATTRAAQTIATFEALDRNADGQISRTEAGYDRQLSKGFAFIDANGDGFLSLDEYAARDKS